MTAHATISWHDANQCYLMAALAVVRAALGRHAAQGLQVTGTGGGGATALDDAAIERELHDAEAALPAPSALHALVSSFGLSEFERALLLMCAGPELDGAFGALLASAHGDPARTAPTFGLAFAALAGAHWSAASPDAALRGWRMIETGAAGTLTGAPLRIDERILHYLAGASHLDDRLTGLVEPVEDADELVPSHEATARRLADLWAGAPNGVRPRPAQLCGSDPARRAIALAACSALGMRLFVAGAHAVPTAPAELEAFIRLWEREAILSGAALLVECDAADASDRARESCLVRLIERLRTPLIISAAERRATGTRSAVTFTVRPPTTAEQRTLWHAALGDASAVMNGAVDRMASQFSLGLVGIRSAAAAAGTPEELWEACRETARPALEALAQRIEPAAQWDDLVLPAAQLRVLKTIALHLRQRTTVYGAWGFAGRGARGLGLSALFAGASGTGKTMAAEVVAAELRLDLFRIDLSSVVSKYIGETEKNLRKLFDAAEEGGAVLFFDEADALFGKRTEVRDSHDRYANIEVSYLLQRMESYRGLAILTTNMRSALDTAFLRRLRFIVEFPFPGPEERLEIWRRAFPAATPVEGLDYARLARLNVAGGNISNIALGAAFIAADAGTPVTMAHIMDAARAEYAKLERTLTATEAGR